MEIVSDYIIDYALISKFDVDSLRKNFVLPIMEDDIYTICAVCNESDLDFAKSCFFNLIKYIEVSKNDILFYLSSFKKRANLYSLVSKSILLDHENHLNIKQFLEKFLLFGIEKRVSDIHIETEERSLSIRCRIDGKLKHFFSFDKKFYKMLSSLIKLNCNLDITQYRKPLDGRMNFVFNDEKYDFRVSILPTILGESIVIRVLDSKGIEKKLNALDFSSKHNDTLYSIKDMTQGLVLICGPTGSGKTTTLYSVLNSMDLSSKKVITVEDPVEYKIKGVQQINVNEKLELDFSNILRNILRQDPDVIFIGEIRDSLSLKIAIQASLTGHLVLSTIHASSALNSLSRLMQLGAQHYLLATTLKIVFYQRLILKICPYCNFEGCDKCNYTKYQGRTTIAEVIKMDHELSVLISNNRGLDEMKHYLKNVDYQTILEDGKSKVKKGVTSLDEIYKVLGFENEI